MSQNIKHVVRLSSDERAELQRIVDQGLFSKSVRQRCRILLKADEGELGPAWEDARVREFAEVSQRTVERVRKRFVTEGFDAGVFRKPSSNRQYRKLDGVGEARLIATACSQPPQERSRWTLKLLAEELVALEVVESICEETVRQVLKKTNSNLICENNG